MQIADLQAFTFPVSLKYTFRHASARRASAYNFIVKATSKEGLSGFGEGCPRTYVTGEDLESCIRFLNQQKSDILHQVQDVASLLEWTETHRSEIDLNPSAFCAIELSLLDLIGRSSSQTLEQSAGVEARQHAVKYSAVLGDSAYTVFWFLRQRYLKRDFRDFKIKLSGRQNRDFRRLRSLPITPIKRHSIRLDANNLWGNSTDAVSYLRNLPQLFWAVEEPLAPRDFPGLTELNTESNIRVILDESCTRLGDLNHVSGPSWICNLRLSKLGGLLRSIEVAKCAQERGLDLIVGAQVGETSILSRAALALVQALHNSQIATEGAFGEHLLSFDLTKEVIQFDDTAYVKWEDFACFNQAGTGLTVNEENLSPLVV